MWEATAPSETDFSKIINHHCSSQETNPICTDCSKNGYTPRDCSRHYCTACEKHGGNLNFDQDDSNNSKKEDRSTSTQCKDCKGKLQCGACLKMYEKPYWSKKEKNNENFQKSCLVCTTRRAKGYRPKDPTLYSCRTCGLELGTAHFKKDALTNFKYHAQIKPECITCEKAVDGRLNGVAKGIAKKYLFCTCYCQMHTARCHLSPRYFGE